MENTHVGREFLKAYGWSRRGTSDQQKGVPMPAIQKALPENAQTLNLVDPAEFKVGNVAVLDVIKKRQSRRRFTNEPLTLEELSYLLWATQGLRAAHRDGRPSFRTVPSAGARHPFETYVAVHRVEGLEPGFYRYLPLDHKLCLIYQSDSLPDVVTEACIGQRFVAEAAAVFVWTVIPYRAEWRYAVASHKHIALDAGHVCQNLYIAAESIGAGTCAIGAYDQDAMDRMVGVDGEDEFVIYAAPVGKVPKE